MARTASKDHNAGPSRFREALSYGQMLGVDVAIELTDVSCNALLGLGKIARRRVRQTVTTNVRTLKEGMLSGSPRRLLKANVSCAGHTVTQLAAGARDTAELAATTGRQLVEPCRSHINTLRMLMAEPADKS